jgi:branched-chain amino acid transport system ATP-binding protein
MLRVSDIDARIGPVQILYGVGLAIDEGEMGGLIGRNGAGKTTFMRALMGLVPATGTIELGEVDLMAVPPYRRPHFGLGYMPEDRRLVPEFTVEENLMLPAWSIGLDGAGGRLEWVFGLMPEIEKFRQSRAIQLSGGQQKMVALGRALMAGTRLLLLDEPFEGLAPALARRLAEVLSDLKQEGVSVLLAESNETHVADLLDRIFHIERGRILAPEPGPGAKAASTGAG